MRNEIHGWSDWDHRVTYRQLAGETGIATIVPGQDWTVRRTDTEVLIGFIVDDSASGVTSKPYQSFTAGGKWLSDQDKLNDAHNDIDRAYRHRKLTAKEGAGA